MRYKTISVCIHPKDVIMCRIPAVEVRGIAVVRGPAMSPSTVRKAQCLVLKEKVKHRKVLNEGCSTQSTCSRRQGKKRCPSCSKLGGQEFLGRKLKSKKKSKGNICGFQMVWNKRQETKTIHDRNTFTPPFSDSREF